MLRCERQWLLAQPHASNARRGMFRGAIWQAWKCLHRLEERVQQGLTRQHGRGEADCKCRTNEQSIH